MKIAIIGTGVSGLTSAYLLSQKHDVTVYEADDRIGGHTATKNIEYQGKTYAVDTGFIVFNDWTYPHFQKLMAKLKVDSQKTDMGFSVSCEQSGLEYSGNNLDTLFAQRRNIFSLTHWAMIRDILRFNKEAPLAVAEASAIDATTLGEYLEKHHYSDVFIDKYLIPMGAAIWSASTSVMKQFPLQFFVKFFINHGLLSVNHRPQWHVLKGGSQAYLKPLTEKFSDRIRLSSPIKSVIRKEDNTRESGFEITVETLSGEKESFDHVIIAAHSDQALTMLGEEASQQETDILGAIAYRDNDVVLHTDEALLPKVKKTWSSWNYRILGDSNDDQDEPPVLTYNMNILQGLEAPCTFCVTLNKTDAIDPQKIIGRYSYAHPVFSVEAVKAQQRWEEINGVSNTWFCGAYWFNGFHEDGVKSAVRIAEKFDIHL